MTLQIADCRLQIGKPVRRRVALGVAVLVCMILTTLTTVVSQALPDERRLTELRAYIKNGWTTLSRSNRDLPRALPDPKMPRPPGARWLLYIAATESKA